MRRAKLAWLTGICALLCIFGNEASFRAKPVYAQHAHPQNDSCTDVDSSFDVSAYIDIDADYNLYADSYIEVESDSCDDISVVEIDTNLNGEGVEGGPTERQGSDYAELETYASAYPGQEYDLDAEGYAYFDFGDPNESGGWQDVGSASASAYVPGLPVQLTGISPPSANAGDYLLINLQGSCFGSQPLIQVDSSEIQIGRTLTPQLDCGSNNTISANVQITQAQPAGVVNFTVTNTQYNTSASIGFTVLPVITGLSPQSAAQGTQNFTLQILGVGFGTSPTVNFSAAGVQIGTPIAVSNTVIDLSVSIDSNAPVASYPVSVTSGGQISNTMTFSVTAAAATPSGPPPDPCAVASSPQSAYSSLTGTPGGSGAVTVSFSGAAYSAISLTVSYGPYSTPSSVAASIAALITYNYKKNGLTARAFGPNVVYSGKAAVGTVNHAFTGASWTSVNSPAAEASAEMACESAPPAPPAACPGVPSTRYVLAVEHDSVSWVTPANTMQTGREITYSLLGWPTPQSPNGVLLPSTDPGFNSTVTEHLSVRMAGGFTSSSNVSGQFDDILGRTLVGMSSGYYTSDRCFTVTAGGPSGPVGQSLGWVQSFDYAGGQRTMHPTDHIQINLSTSTTIMNSYVDKNGNPISIALP